MADNKVNSGLLEFSEDQKVFVALDAETSEVKKAVTIDEDGVETDIQGVQPSGKKEITSTAEVNVANYATAQVVDEDLIAGNIKKDVDILGVVGSYEGGGASDFSTAEVTITSLNGNTILIPYVATDNGVSYLNEVVSDPETYNVALYDGKAMGIIFNPQGVVTTTGNITYADGTFLISGNGTIDIRAAV